MKRNISDKSWFRNAIIVPHRCYSVLQVAILLCRLVSLLDAICHGAPSLIMKSHGHALEVVPMETFQVMDRLRVTLSAVDCIPHRARN